MPVIPFEGRIPKIHPTAFVAPTAMIIGDVTIEENASVWYGCVLRGDLDPIYVGKGSNIQDNSVLHTGKDEPCIVKDHITVGHMACLHGCTIEDGCLIGMMATVLNRTVIPKDSVVGAGSLVPEGKSFEERSLILGLPAKAVRKLTQEDVEGSYFNTAKYVENAKRHRVMMEEHLQRSGYRV